jgi:predicted ATPase
MRIGAVRYQNFKRYDDCIFDLDFPVSVLVGPNSSGKSSLIKGLLAFKQTFEDQGDHSGFLASGEYADIGTFIEYSMNHDPKAIVKFAFLVKEFSLSIGSRSRQFNSFVLEFCHQIDPQHSHGRLQKYSIFLCESEDSSFLRFYEESGLSVSYTRLLKQDEAYRIKVSRSLYELYMESSRDNRYVHFFNERPFEEFDTSTEYGIQAQRSTERGMVSGIKRQSALEGWAFATHLENTLVSQVHRVVSQEITSLTFAIAGIREGSQRSFRRTDEKLKVGSRGQNAPSVFMNLRQRAIKAGQRHARISDDMDRLFGWIQQLRLSSSVEANSWRDLMDLRVTTFGDSQSMDSIVDVGIGFSQVFPILVQMAVMPEGSRLIIEQPELHLYPWAQRILGEIIAEEALRGRKKIIIETHSEHVIRGIQIFFSRSPSNRHIPIPTDNALNILYIHENGRFQRLKVSDTGEFTERWPPGFFDQGLEATRIMIENRQSGVSDD